MTQTLPPGVDRLAPYWERVRAYADPDVHGLGRFQRRPKPAELQELQRMADCHPGRPHRAHGLCSACHTRLYRAMASR